MRTSLAILAAAVVGFGGATFNSAPASAVTLTPLVHQGAAGDRQLETMHVAHGGWHRGQRWRSRDRTGRAIGYGLLGFGAGLALGQLAQPRYHTYGGHPHYQTYGGHPPHYTYGGQPQYRVYGGDPYFAPRGQAGTAVDNRDPIHRP